MSATPAKDTVDPRQTPDPSKLADLPPTGPRNPDPITGSPGSHPIETGIGAMLGGAASGAAVGLAASGPLAPLGAMVGAVVGGAIAGGLAGKGIGELIDPTTEDNWIRNLLAGKPANASEEWETHARDAYRFGWRSESSHPKFTFAQAEDALRGRWEAEYPTRPWADHRGNVRDGFEQGAAVNRTNDATRP